MSSEHILNALTVDVEEHFHVSAFARAVRRDDWGGLESRVEANTERLLQLFADAGVRATFFVLGWVAERRPGLVRRIADGGHEVACHGWSHRLIYHQDPATFESETSRAKAVLEDHSGQTVRGYRAASYSITSESLWALDILAKLGFTYDSSIFPVHHDLYGIPGSRRWPHLLATPGGDEIVEFPISTASLAGLRLPVAGGGYFRIYPYLVTRWGLRSINREGHPFVFYLHPWEIDPGQPRLPGVGLKSRFRHYTNLRRCEPRLRQLLSEFSLGTCSEVLEGLDLIPAEAAAGTRDPALA